MALNLPRLPNGQAIVGKDGLPTLAFTVYWQQVLEALETQEGIQDDLIADILAAQAAAAAAQDTADASMPDLAPITVAADYTGTVETGQLPRNVAAKRYDGAVDVTTASAWSHTVVTGGITATIGAATGVLNITAVTSSGTVNITSVHNGISLTRTLVVTRTVAGASSGGGGGGTSATDTTFASFNSTSHATVSDVLTVTTGTGGQVQLSAPLSVFTTGGAPAAVLEVFGIWQWDSTGGGVWVDLGTEVSNDPYVVVELVGPGQYAQTEGALSVAYLATGLPASSSQKFRLNARNGTGTRVMYLSGTASAVGS